MSGDDPVRPYVYTRGRSRPSRNTIRPESLLIATAAPAPVSATRRHRDLLEVCRGALSLAEAAAHLGLTVSVLAVLASDLVDSGHLAVQSAAPPRHDPPDRHILEKVLEGLRAL